MTDTNINPPSIMTPSIESTISFVAEAHKGQLDKNGQPYILHILRVMNRLGMYASEEERLVALLHDILEDTPVTDTQLSELGYSQKIIDAVYSVTKRWDEDVKGPGSEEAYFRAIKRASENKIGRRVKIADLGDNTDPKRNNTTISSLDRLAKYNKALVMLLSIELEEQYVVAATAKDKALCDIVKK